MAFTHSFWNLPAGWNPDVDRILHERSRILGVLPLGEDAQQDAKSVQALLEEFCIRKRRLAIHVNDRMMLEGMLAFMDLKTLRSGWIPTRGIPMRGMAVIPPSELPRLMVDIMTLPPAASWTRLYNLCGEAFRKEEYIIHYGIHRE